MTWLRSCTLTRISSLTTRSAYCPTAPRQSIERFSLVSRSNPSPRPLCTLNSHQHSPDKQLLPQNRHRINTAPSSSFSNKPTQTSSIRNCSTSTSISKPPPRTSTIASNSPAQSPQQDSPTPKSTSAPESTSKSTSTSAHEMSDEDYSAFLERASADQPQTKSQAKSSSKDIKLQTASEPLPEPLSNVSEHVYVSDADEPFEGVNLGLSDSEELSAETLSKLLGIKVTQITHKQFDPKNQYDAVVNLVKKINKDISFWTSSGDGARVDYFVLTVDGGRVVGVRARSVES